MLCEQSCDHFRVVIHMCPPYVQKSKIKSHSPFQVENNKISQDVKGLFLGVRSRVSVISSLGCSSRTSCMSRWGVVLEYVRGLLGLGWLYSPLVLGLIRDKSRLLKG